MGLGFMTNLFSPSSTQKKQPDMNAVGLLKKHTTGAVRTVKNKTSDQIQLLLL